MVMSLDVWLCFINSIKTHVNITTTDCRMCCFNKSMKRLINLEQLS